MANSDELRVQITAFDDRPIVVVQGEVEITTAAAFAEALRTVTTLDAPELLVDLSGVTFMDSTGVGVLVMAARRVTMRIVGASPMIARVLEIAGFDELSNAGEGHDTRQGEYVS